MTTDASGTNSLGRVLDAQATLVKSGRRRSTALFVVLALVIAALVYQNQAQRSSSQAKDVTIAAQTKTMKSQTATITALQSKSAEQTVAEVQLRDDVNSFRKLNAALQSNHTAALAVYCSLAQSLHPPDTLPPVHQYCP